MIADENSLYDIGDDVVVAYHDALGHACRAGGVVYCRYCRCAFLGAQSPPLVLFAFCWAREEIAPVMDPLY